MIPFNLEWLSLLVRWMHVFTGILWVGTIWYFAWLDYRLREATARARRVGDSEAVWLAVGGGVYKVERPATSLRPATMTSVTSLRWAQ